MAAAAQLAHERHQQRVTFLPISGRAGGTRNVNFAFGSHLPAPLPPHHPRLDPPRPPTPCPPMHVRSPGLSTYVVGMFALQT